jgi:pilus assembly protein CpaE
MFSVTDLRRAPDIVEEEAPSVVVVGVDADDDPTLRTVKGLDARASIEAGILVISQNPSRSLLVACMRAGSDEFLEYPIDPDELREALGHLYEKTGLQGGGGGRVTAIYSAKGGTGNTTVATNVAATIARGLGTQTSSCILDVNTQFWDVALMMDIQEFPKSVADACMDADRMDASLLQGYMTYHDSGAAVLPAPLDLDQMDEVDPANLIGVIQEARGIYRHVILDLPHQLDTLALAGLDSADEVYIICDMLLPAIHNTKRVTGLLEELEYSKSHLKLIINRFYESNEISVQEISEHVQLPVHWLIPYESSVAIEGANTGQMVDQIDRRSPLSRSLTALARDMAGLEIKKEKKKFSFFGLR